MDIKTIKDGNLEILMQGNLKSPYPPLSHEVTIGGEKADIVAVTNQITCTKNGRVYKGYKAYILKDVTQEAPHD